MKVQRVSEVFRESPETVVILGRPRNTSVYLVLDDSKGLDLPVENGREQRKAGKFLGRAANTIA